MSKIILKILDWIRKTFFETDILPPSPQPTPEPEPTPPPAPLPPVPTQNKLELWVSAITEMENDKPSRNNPGSLRFLGQKYAKNDNGFCAFDTLEHGIEALKTLLINACTGKSKVYYPEMTLLEFQKTYSPSSDGNNPFAYANFVAHKIGCTIDTPIKDLIS